MHVRNHRLSICDHYLSTRNLRLSIRNRRLGIRNHHVGVDRQLRLKGGLLVRVFPTEAIKRTLNT